MEITNYPETVEALDTILAYRSDDDLLFGFGSRMAAKIVERASERAEVKCSPRGEKVRLKDLRSSMACDLLSKGCSTDEANRRLGHRPGSREIQKYANWLALDTRKAKQRLQQHKSVSLESEQLRATGTYDGSAETSKEAHRLNSHLTARDSTQSVANQCARRDRSGETGDARKPLKTSKKRDQMRPVAVGEQNSGDPLSS